MITPGQLTGIIVVISIISCGLTLSFICDEDAQEWWLKVVAMPFKLIGSIATQYHERKLLIIKHQQKVELAKISGDSLNLIMLNREIADDTYQQLGEKLGKTA